MTPRGGSSGIDGSESPVNPWRIATWDLSAVHEAYLTTNNPHDGKTQDRFPASGERQAVWTGRERIPAGQCGDDVEDRPVSVQALAKTQRSLP